MTPNSVAVLGQFKRLLGSYDNTNTGRLRFVIIFLSIYKIVNYLLLYIDGLIRE